MKEIVQKIITAAESLGVGGTAIVSIDGRCGAGKSTLADMISARLAVPVIHMDHFFLRPEQRVPERLREIGGNVDRERFLEEVLIPLRNKKSCSYRAYNCSTGELGESICVPASAIYIIEGSYSCHPELWEYSDIHVFLTTDPVEQMRRITEREGEDKADVFRRRWIPMEEKYFSAFRIERRCDFVFDTTDKTDEMRRYYESL